MKKLFKILVAVTVAAATCLCTCTFVSAVPSTSAQGMVLINADTLEVLASHNADKKLPMASTTKIMTALLLAEEGTPEKQIVTTKEMVTVEGSSMGLLEGDTISYHALLVGMMLASGNDAANTTAIAVGGTVSEFVEMMNSRAKAIGMTDTNFVTPSGLDGEEHYSTAYDMALLAAEAIKNPYIKEVASSQKIAVNYGNPPYKRTLKNHNKLLSIYDGCIGLKTGFTKKSGRCLVSAAERNGCTVIAVTLNDPDDWDDHINLLEYGLSSVKPQDITYKFDDDTLAVVGGNADRVRISTPKVTVGVSDASKDKITAKANLIPFVYADVKAGQQVGSVDYYYSGALIRTEPIVALCDVDFEIVKKPKLSEKFILKFKMLLEHII
jgi:D-alanyl-D-alanine carboxypeptidase/D-alanyl-D-alanine carboxypeptidase (penicillin-binding protein 5/6)